jgi:hypothetical protein
MPNAPRTPPGGTLLDLDAIIATGWADPTAFPREEFTRAEAFWQQRRTHDPRLLATRATAAAQIETWTGRTPRDVGSFGNQLNLDTSDLDLGIGYPVVERDVLRAALDGHATFKGERYTSFRTTRLVYTFTIDGTEIDLSALTEQDFTIACRMLDQIDAGMTREERIAHTWVKHLLWTAGRRDDYAAWKLVTYARYCPEFNWVPIPEPTS